VKIKELLTEGWKDVAAVIAGGMAGKSAEQSLSSLYSYNKRDDKSPKKTKDIVQDPKDKIQEPIKQDTKPTTDISEPDKPTGNPNANLDSKISYAKSKGWVGQRPTNQEKNYLDTVEVYVNPNMLKDIPAERNFVPHRPPHEKLSLGSFKAPTAEINRALGFKGQEQITGFSSFVLTPAGWYAKNRQAYINPNSKAQDIVDMFWEKSQGGRK